MELGLEARERGLDLRGVATTPVDHVDGAVAQAVRNRFGPDDEVGLHEALTAPAREQLVERIEAALGHELADSHVGGAPDDVGGVDDVGLGAQRTERATLTPAAV